MTQNRFSRPYRALFALVGGFALTLQYSLMVQGNRGSPLGELTLNYFSFFTILSNIMVFLALLLPALAPHSRAASWFNRANVRGAITLYITVVGVTYHFLLASTWDPQGWSLLANNLLHYVMPAAFIADWLLFTPKGQLTWSSPLKWLAVVLAYGAWTLLHGSLAHWWPYWFINVDTLGLGKVAIHFVGLLLFFLVAGFVILGLDHVLGQRDRRAAPT